MQFLDQKIWETAFSYTEYRDMIDGLVAEGKTTGTNHSPAMMEYTTMNVSRMRRWDKSTRLTDETVEKLQNLQTSIRILVIAEAWCGDAAQVLPVVAKMAEQNANIQLKIVLRDENTELIDQFLTNGGRSIPIFVLLDAKNNEILGHWGPRPKEAQDLYMGFRKRILTLDSPEERKVLDEEGKAALHLWYAKNKALAIQTEFMEAVHHAFSLLTA